jgi:PhnB protein
MAKAKSPVPAGFHTVTPQLTMQNAASAIEWYQKGFGAEEVSRALGPDGRIIHAEIRVGNSVIMLNDDMGGGAVPANGGSRIAFWLFVADCDALYERAVKAGARVADGPMGGMQDMFWGDRVGTIVDPEGFRWNIATRKEDLTQDEMMTRQDEWMRQFAASRG